MSIDVILPPNTSRQLTMVMLCSILALGGCRPSSGELPNTDEDASEVKELAEVDELGSKKISKPIESIRIATFNLSLNRKRSQELLEELQTGDSPQIKKVAEVIQRIRPDVILLNEIDFDPDGKSVELFCANYLSVGQRLQQPINFNYFYTGPVNTGVDSGMDLNNNGELREPEDAFGYGAFPGQYGMAVLSQFPIEGSQVRTFQKFLWKDMPDAKLPQDPGTGQPYYSESVLNRFRLSSKSVWDLPIRVKGRTLHLIGAHPTPPVFDGPEDRNGTRNHDEIRFLADYVNRDTNYIYDDSGNKAALSAEDSFVIAGDLNADPHDGESLDHAAKQLTENERINNSKVPNSRGAAQAATNSGGANLDHAGASIADTGDFSDDNVGNLRVDYVLPSSDLTISHCGVYWPATNQQGSELNSASDHHLVWVDIQFN